MSSSPPTSAPRPCRAGRLSPEVHLEGTQPAPDADVIQALNQALISALAGSGPKLTPKISYLHGGSGLDTLDYFGPAFIGLVIFFLVFVVTSVSFLRERSQGTLERLMASPLRRGRSCSATCSASGWWRWSRACWCSSSR